MSPNAFIRVSPNAFIRVSPNAFIRVSPNACRIRDGARFARSLWLASLARFFNRLNKSLNSILVQKMILV